MHELWNIRTPLAQAGKMNCDHVQPEVEIFAKRSGSVRCFQIAVRGGNHADIHWILFVASHRPDFFFLQHSQKLGLHLERQFTDFIEENCAAISRVKQSRL